MANASCASTTAMGIVRGRCIGLDTCTVSPQADFVSKWYPNTALGTDCEQTKKINVRGCLRCHGRDVANAWAVGEGLA